MEYYGNHEKLKIQNKVSAPVNGVTLTDGKLSEAFENNIAFLKRFDIDRMLYWFREAAGKPSLSTPYSYGSGHFEDNLHGQTAALYLMSAGTALMWKEDKELREKMDAVVDGVEEFRREDGCLLPIPKAEYYTKEYPNYVRAWIYFGLIAAGVAGNKKAFGLVRGFGDWFNECECLPYVKDLNLGFQGILANTELYLSPIGTDKDLEVAQKYYREDWWLDWLDKEQQRAIYQKPGDHPHGTLLTTLEAYLDIYRITGEEYLLNCVQKALKMYEDKWQHVGGGIVMCECGIYASHYPGCNNLSHEKAYNELCCSTFWILLNQRMHLLFPDEVHYVDQYEQSIYNVLLACQEKDLGYRYHAWLTGTKDDYTNLATCCAATGARLVSMLPQFLYTYNQEEVYIDMFASSQAEIGNTKILVETDMPYNGKVKITVEKMGHKKLKVRIPKWCDKGTTVNGMEVAIDSYITFDCLKDGDVIELELKFAKRVTKYSGSEHSPEADKYAIEYGPLLLAALWRYAGVKFNLDDPEIEEIGKGRYRIAGNQRIEYRAYMDISDESFTVYPTVVK